MTDPTETTGTESAPADPAQIIAQVLVETRDSVDTEQAIAERVLAALEQQGVVCTTPETAEAQ